MPVSYPIGLSIPLLKGYSNVDDLKFRRDKIDHSPLKYANLTSTGSMVAKCQWSLSALEWQVFDGWYRHDLHYGSKSFNMAIKIKGSLVTHAFYFLGSYKTVPKGKIVTITATLIALDKNYDDLTAYEAARDSLATPNTDGIFSERLIGDDDEEIASTFINYKTSEVLQSDADLLRAASSMYSEASKGLGFKKYYEITPLSLQNETDGFNFWVGWCIDGEIVPDVDLGQTINCLGYARNSGRYVSTVFSSSAGFNYVVDDIIGISLDYSTQDVETKIYLNNVLQDTVIHNMPLGSSIRAAAKISGAGVNGAGGSGKMCLAESDFVYSVPSGFEAWDLDNG